MTALEIAEAEIVKLRAELATVKSEATQWATFRGIAETERDEAVAESERLQSALAEATAEQNQLAARLEASIEERAEIEAECDLLAKQRDDALAQRDACGGESIALRIALTRIAERPEGPQLSVAGVIARDALAAPSPSAEVMAARLAEAQENQAYADRVNMQRLLRGEEAPMVGPLIVSALAEHDAKVRADALEEAIALAIEWDPDAEHDSNTLVGALRERIAASPHPAPAPTVAPAAGEAKHCETCGDTGEVLAGPQRGLRCPRGCSCAPEKGGAR